MHCAWTPISIWSAPLWHKLAQAIRNRFLMRSPAPRAPGHQGLVLSVAARLTWLGTVPTDRVLGPGGPLLPGHPGSPPRRRRSRHTPRLSTRRQPPPRPCRRRHSRQLCWARRRLGAGRWGGSRRKCGTALMQKGVANGASRCTRSVGTSASTARMPSPTNNGRETASPGSRLTQ